MIDVTDYGCVYNPRTQRHAGGVSSQEDAVFGVRKLQITEPYIIGNLDSRSSEHLGQGNAQIDSYFVLDTRTGKRTSLPNYDSLRDYARQRGILLNLETIFDVYSRYRFSWFEVATGISLCGLPMIYLIFLLRWIVRLRRTRISIGPLLSP
jgi:hypothetical protein